MSKLSALRSAVVVVLTVAWVPMFPAAAQTSSDSGAVAQPAAGPAPIYARIDIDAIGSDLLREIKETAGLVWWVELDDRLLVLAEEPVLAAIEGGRSVERLEVEPRASRLFLLRGARHEDLVAMDVDVLAAGGRYAVIQTRGAELPRLTHTHGGEAVAHSALQPFEPGLVLARQAANQARPPRPLASRVVGLIDEVDEQRWFNDIVVLADYNRHTHGPEIDDARDWLVQQFEGLPGLTVTTESFEVGATTAWNVISTLPGTVRPDDLYIIGAHYDSTSQSTATAAPGAEDNASGCAGVLEMARIFTAQPPEATLLFICYSGEEQGLFGSDDHASDLVAAGLDDQVMAVLTMDMIGFTTDADLDVLLETSSANSALADAFAAAAVLTDLRTVISFNPFGSDHVPYLNRGMPALLTIENDWDMYPCYHNTCDLPANITLAMGGETLKMNVVAMAQMIGFGQIFADGFESGNTNAWSSAVP